MVRAESVSATVVYTYGLDSLLVGRSAGGAAATYAWDWATGVPEMLSDGERLYLVGQETLGWADGVEWSYPLGDALGSVRQVVDGAGEVLDGRSWTPFGVEEGTAQGGLGYTGEWWDAEVSLLYLRARWYDPAAGRFTTEDPLEGELESPMSYHRWLYSYANPVNFTDPSGQIPDPPSRTPFAIDTPILDMPWIDQNGEEPNSCGPIALYMFLKGEGVDVRYKDVVRQLKDQKLGGYDPSCKENPVCTSAEALAVVARNYYGLSIESGDNWTEARVYEKLRNHHPVLTLVRIHLTANTEGNTGHFVVVRGLLDNGSVVVYNDSYPDPKAETLPDTEAILASWSEFDASWASRVDKRDPMGQVPPGMGCVGWAPNWPGHVRWAMSVR